MEETKSIFSAKPGDIIIGPYGVRLTVIADEHQWAADDELVVYLLRVADEVTPPPDPVLATRTQTPCSECGEQCWVCANDLPVVPAKRYICLRCAAIHHPVGKDGFITLQQLETIKVAILRRLLRHQRRLTTPL
jgi:hypothetical protein